MVEKESKRMMINFEYLERQASYFARTYKSAKPFSYLIIDNVCDDNVLRDLLQEIPDPVDAKIKKSRDLVFAKNKFEKSQFASLGPNMKKLDVELSSRKFAKFLTKITGDEIFVDGKYHGGGLHQGGPGSFLNMHADFDYHPENPNWFRNINILIYLNEHWKPEYKGELKLKDGRASGSSTIEIEPKFNRMVIMKTREYTLHGYDEINFPPFQYRKSIAAYGYTFHENPKPGRTTVWHPEDGGKIKAIFGKAMPTLVKIKKRLIGSGTAKNK